jgi:hypothetical protein
MGWKEAMYNSTEFDGNDTTKQWNRPWEEVELI